MVDDPDGADAPMVGDHLAVMGTDGGTGLRRQLLRNVAERVLRRVAVSIMTVWEEDADLLEFDETAGRRRTRAGRRGVPLLASSRSTPESAFLSAGPTTRAVFSYARAGRSADVGWELERGRPLAQRGRASRAREAS